MKKLELKLNKPCFHVLVLTEHETVFFTVSYNNLQFHDTDVLGEVQY